MSDLFNLTASGTDPREVISLLERAGYKEIELKRGYIKIGYWKQMNSFDQILFYATLKEETQEDEDCGTLYSYRII